MPFFVVLCSSLEFMGSAKGKKIFVFRNVKNGTRALKLPFRAVNFGSSRYVGCPAEIIAVPLPMEMRTSFLLPSLSRSLATRFLTY